LTVKGGATIKPCGGQECSSGKSWCCTPPTDDELRKICAGQTGDDSTIGSANPGIALGTYSSIEECMDQIETMKLFFIVNVYLHLVHRLHFRRVLKED